MGGGGDVGCVGLDINGKKRLKMSTNSMNTTGKETVVKGSCQMKKERESMAYKHNEYNRKGNSS